MDEENAPILAAFYAREPEDIDLFSRRSGGENEGFFSRPLC